MTYLDMLYNITCTIGVISLGTFLGIALFGFYKILKW